METRWLWPSVPALLLIAAAGYELGRWAVRRRGGATGPFWRLSAWLLRPWAVWAAFNFIYRLNWDRGFNNQRTFPFFANLWQEGEGLVDAVTRVARMPSVWLWGAVAIALLAALVAIGWRVLRLEEPSRATRGASLAAIYVLAVALHLSVACLPRGAGLTGERQGSLLSSWHAHATMLYAVPHVDSTVSYMRNFIDLQPVLRRTIHALSHPPGASLSMYWIGCAMGVQGEDIRNDAVRLRYAIGLTLFGALNVFIIYGLARRLFESSRTGLAAALLWAAMPAVMAYNTHAQDGVYAVFYNLALLLTWRVGTATTRPWRLMVVLGVLFAWLTLLNYSWCLMTSIFALFIGIMAWRRKWPWRELVLRGCVPLTIMTLLSGTILLVARLDYLKMYENASNYVNEWYRFENAYQVTTALIGGQMDIGLLMGGVTLSAFLLAWRHVGRLSAASHAWPFLVIILAIYAMPILFGPSCLKMETARCWNWVAAVPLAFGARVLLRQDRPRIFVCGALATSGLTYVAMRLFMNFAP